VCCGWQNSRFVSTVNIFAYLMNYCHMKRIFTNGIKILKVKVQLSHYRLGQALRVPEG